MTMDRLNVNKETNLIESIVAKTRNCSTSDESNELKEFKFNCKHLIIDSSYAPKEYFNDLPQNNVSRCVLVTNKSLFNQTENEEKSELTSEQLSFLFLPNKTNGSDIYMLELSPASLCCPKGFYLVYLFCKSVKQTANLDFEECIQTYFADQATTADLRSENTKPRILFSFYYSHVDSNHRIENFLKQSNNVPSNLHIVGASKVELDFDFHVALAEKIFRKICPSEEFLPRPPEQEDIIFDCNESSSTSESPQESKDVNEATYNEHDKNKLEKESNSTV